MRRLFLLVVLVIYCSTSVMCGTNAVAGKEVEGDIALEGDVAMRTKRSTNAVAGKEMEGDHFEGDIAMRTKPSTGGQGAMLAALRDTSKRWPGGKVPYRIDTDSIPNLDHHRLIRRAMDQISEKVTCLKFVENEKLARPKRDFIRIASDGDDKNSALGCWSYLGMVGGEQTLNLDGNCFREDIVIHEILHALSFIHEQNRSDRDNYVKIHNEHIKPGMESQFSKRNEADVDDNNTPYDFRSRLHYPPTAFSKSGEDTIVALYPGNDNFGPMDAGLSPIDIVEVSILYDCPVNNKDIIEYIHQNRLANEMRIEILDEAHFEDMEEMKTKLDNVTSQLTSEIETIKSALSKLPMNSQIIEISKLPKKQGRSGCQDGWSQFRSSCYKMFILKKSWSSASAHCKSLKAELASIHSEEENQFLINLAKSQNANGYVWIGGTYDREWSDGSTWDYENWMSGQPDSKDGVALRMQPDDYFGQWQDISYVNNIFFYCKM